MHGPWYRSSSLRPLLLRNGTVYPLRITMRIAYSISFAIHFSYQMLSRYCYWTSPSSASIVSSIGVS